jgi:hypothetical protein
MSSGLDAELNALANEAPTFKVTIAGIGECTQTDTQGLQLLLVEGNLDKIGIARVTFDQESIKPGGIAIGGDVSISVGGDTRKAFEGYVTGINHTWSHGKERVTIIAMDPLIKLAASRVTKVWGGEPSDKFKDSKLADDVIGAGGCTAGTVDATDGERAYILQRNESNLSFLKRLAARNGYLVYADEGKVNFVKPQFSGSPLKLGQPDIIKMDYTRSDRSVPSKVKVHGWDYIKKDVVSGEGEASGAVTIGSGAVVSPTTWAAETHISDVFVNSDTAALAMAKGEMARMTRSYVQGTCVINGNGAIYPGVLVEFLGSYEKFNPSVVVVATRHSIEIGSFYQTQFWFVSNTMPA